VSDIDQFYDEPDELYDDPSEFYNVGSVDPPPEQPPPNQSEALQRQLPKAPPVAAYKVLVGGLYGGVVEELPFSRLNYGYIRNRPGGFSGSVKRPNPKLSLQSLGKPPFSLYVERDGVILWGGIIWTLEPRTEEMQFGGEGFWSFFRKMRHRGIDDPLSTSRKLKRYNDVDTFIIVRDLIDWVQSEHPDNNLGVVVDDHNAGVARDEVFRPHEWRNIGEAIEEMGDDNPGFDFSLDVGWEGDALRKRLRLYSSRARTTDIVFDTAKNCTLRSRTITANNLVRGVMSTGKGSGPGIKRQFHQDETMTGQFPYWREVISDPDVESLVTLDSRAIKTVNRNLRPMETISLDVTPQADLPLGSWRIGDQVRVRAEDDYEDVDDFYRITAWEVEVDEAGQEVVRMDFGPIPT